MEKNHPPPHHQPRDFFNVFSENHISSKGLQESSSSSSFPPPPPPNFTVSTELSLSSSSLCSSSSIPSFTKTRTKHTHQYFSNRNNTERKQSKPPYNYFRTQKEESHHESNIICHSSSSGCSTALKLYDDPWKIKKVLTASDIGKLNRLLLSTENSMEDLVVSVLGNNNSRRDDDEELLTKGLAVRVWDVETKSTHQLILKQWASIKNFVLIGNWSQDFVKRRNLKKGDEIGLQWDPFNLCFNFSVLKRSSVME